MFEKKNENLIKENMRFSVLVNSKQKIFLWLFLGKKEMKTV